MRFLILALFVDYGRSWSMKIGLLCPEIGANPSTNQRRIIELAEQAVGEGVEFIVLPESVLTGLTNTGNPEHDYSITEQLLGPMTSQWKAFSRSHGVYFAAGFLERDHHRMYDSAVLFDPSGKIVIHYRRMDPNWHGSNDDSSIYCEGLDLPVKETALGRTALLLCGDLWNDDIIHRLVSQTPDVLLFLFARSIDTSEERLLKWRSELEAYANRWSSLGCDVLAVNLLGDGDHDTSIGGAWTMHQSGELEEIVPILQEGYAVIDLFVP